MRGGLRFMPVFLSLFKLQKFGVSHNKRPCTFCIVFYDRFGNIILERAVAAAVAFGTEPRHKANSAEI